MVMIKTFYSKFLRKLRNHYKNIILLLIVSKDLIFSFLIVGIVNFIVPLRVERN